MRILIFTFLLSLTPLRGEILPDGNRESLNREAPISLSCSDKAAQILALSESKNYLKRSAETWSLDLEGKTYSKQEIWNSLDQIHDSLKQCKTETDFFPLAPHFTSVLLTEKNENPLVTGYYDVEIEAVSEPTGEFRYPILKTPETHSVLWNQTKSQIVSSHGWKKKDVIAYVKLTALHLAHLEGSAVLLLDGKRVRLNYANHNGKPYRSPALDLEGVCESLKPSELETCFWLHPEPVTKAILANPRFIFFEVEKDIKMNRSALGSGEIRLVPGRSIAMDKRIPLGLPILLNFESPNLTLNNQLTFVHDRGSEIVGMGRVDFYFGSGNQFSKQANALKTKGRVVLILPKKD